MDKKVYTFEGKTSTEAIEKGLKELKVSKSKVDIKVLEQEDKRSFFSILTPRVVKVEMTLKDNVKEEAEEKKEVKSQPVVKKEHKEVSKEELEESVELINKFLGDFVSKLPQGKYTYNTVVEDGMVKVDINGDDTGYLIGYRGEVLNSIQTIITNIAAKASKERVRVMVNIGGYREKREKDLQNLAVKIAGTVIKTKKDIVLEPMTAYERKVIHTKLQDNDKVKTYSIGEEPYRKVVVTLK